MLGRLRMDVDDCITAYGGLIRALHSADPNQLSNTTLAAAVTDVVAQYSGSTTEAFCHAAENDCKVFVEVSCHDPLFEVLTATCFI